MITLCYPSFFYNIIQSYPFIVFDFKEHTLSQIRLKYSILLNVSQLHDVSSTQQIWDKSSWTQHQDSEKIRLENLFKNRKRNFNFFLPFNQKDDFSDYLMGNVKFEENQDNVKLSLEQLYQLVKKYENNTSVNDYTQQFNQQLQNNQENNHQITQSSPNLDYEQDLELIYNLKIFKIMLQLIEQFKREKFREIVIILKPLEVIMMEYPFMDYKTNKSNLDRSFPNEIVDKKLYLGSIQNATDREIIEEQIGITHIVNSAKECGDYCEKVKYLHIDICDEVSEKIHIHFETVYQFIDEDWDNKSRKILVHCAQGRSRSAAMVVMFLMRKYHWSLEHAYNYVKNRREVVRINEGFIQQLQKFEEQQQQLYK